MAEYIDREAALNVVDFWASSREQNIQLTTAVSGIPAADVAPVVHAHWVWPETERDRPFCSNCLNDAFWDNDHGFVTENFCPFCGAKTDEREGEK